MIILTPYLISDFFVLKKKIAAGYFFFPVLAPFREKNLLNFSFCSLLLPFSSFFCSAVLLPSFQNLRPLSLFT